MTIQIITHKPQKELACRLLLQLRPQYSFEAMYANVEAQSKQGYQLVAAYQGEALVGVAGFRLGENLAWGKHLYIDDLVTDAQMRSKGAGAALIQWLKQYATETGCKQLHLDSGVQRFAAHKFYLNQGFRIASHHFSYLLS